MTFTSREIPAISLLDIIGGVIVQRSSRKERNGAAEKSRELGRKSPRHENASRSPVGLAGRLFQASV